MKQKSMSQRQLAVRSRLSFRTIQLLGKGRHDPKISTLEKVTAALGFRKGGITQNLREYLAADADTLRDISAQITAHGEASWKIFLFNFVDHFRRQPREKLIAEPPVAKSTPRLLALLAGVVEALCHENSVRVPWWCAGVPGLSKPWFVSQSENLKATALQESPVFFRKRNIFVLDNFLLRV